MSLRGLVCLVLRHRPGAEVYRYVVVPPAVGQWPTRRGETRLEAVGLECERCRGVLEIPPEAEAAR